MGFDLMAEKKGSQTAAGATSAAPATNSPQKEKCDSCGNLAILMACSGYVRSGDLSVRGHGNFCEGCNRTLPARLKEMGFSISVNEHTSAGFGS